MSATSEQTASAMSLMQSAIVYHNEADAKMQQAYAVLRTMADAGAPIGVRLPIPWLSQLGRDAAYSNSDCGPACIAMIVRGQGKNVTVDQVSKATGLPIGYTSTMPAHLLKAAFSFGVKMQRAMNLSIESIRETINGGLPVIVLVHYPSLPKRFDPKFKAGHWIVVCGFTHQHKMLYHDPYWPDTTGQYIEIDDDALSLAMSDCAKDGNTANQGIVLSMGLG